MRYIADLERAENLCLVDSKVQPGPLKNGPAISWCEKQAYDQGKIGDEQDIFEMT